MRLDPDMACFELCPVADGVTYSNSCYATYDLT